MLADGVGELALGPAGRVLVDRDDPHARQLRVEGVHVVFEIEELDAGNLAVAERIEQPFEWVIKFRYAGQDPATPAIWWRYAKPTAPKEMPSTLGVAGKDILLLYR